MFAASRVREHIEALEDDKIFTTRDLLYCGCRNAVDLALSKMVKANQIMRVARGVFVRYVEKISSISLFKIAEAKAKAFGNEISRFGRSAALQVGLIKKFKGKDNEFLFYTSGCSTSFKCEQYTIRFVSSCSRKRNLPDTEEGKLLKGIWHFGWPNFMVLRGRARKISYDIGKSHTYEFRKSVRLMPLWISKMFFPHEGKFPPILT